MPIPQLSPKRLHFLLLNCHDQGLLSCLRIRSKTSRILNEEQIAALERVLLSWVTFVFDLRFWNVYLLSLLVFASWVEYNNHSCASETKTSMCSKSCSFTYTVSTSKVCQNFLQVQLPSLKLTAHAWKWIVGIRSFPLGMAYICKGAC